MKRSKGIAAGFVAAGLAAGGAHAQDSAYRDEALAYSQAILSAWTVLERHIRDHSSGVTLIDGLTSTSALTAMGWQGTWTDRGLAARYCSDVLVVLAEDDELKGVGEDHRSVQVVSRPGLQRISGGAAVGAAGRETVTLPACMSGLPDGHVALAAGVLDPWVHTGTRVTWEQRTIACVLPETGTGREERRPLPIQVNGRGLDMAFWPPDCVGRAAGTYRLNGEDVDLPDEAECGPWERVFDGCSTPPPGPSATADPPPNWQFRNVGYSQNGSAVCPSGYAGTSYWTDQWERREMNKDDGAGWFVVASRQQPGTSRQWNHGNCLASGTGACPSGQVGTATWTQAYGQAQVWSYSGCTTVVAQNPGNPGDGDPGGPGGGDPGGNDPGGGGPGSGGPGSTGPGPGGDDTGTSTPGDTQGIGGPGHDNGSVGGNQNGGGGGKPIVLDLDGDGVELVPLEDSTAFFDINGDGYRKRMAWASADDGFLAYDKDGDDAISAHDELSFLSYVENAETDLVGLRHFDTDGDGQLDPDDTEWGMFRVWQDLDQDGESDPGELRSLDEAGIESIALTSDSVKRTVAGSTVYGEGVYVGPHGPRTFYDVVLRIGLREE